MYNVVEGALSKILFRGFEEDNGGFRNAPYYFIESVFTEMSWKGSLLNIFESNFERWTQSSLFMNTSTHRNRNSPWFVRTVLKIICKHLKDHVEINKQKDSMKNNTWSLPESPSFSSKLLNIDKFRKRGIHHCTKTKQHWEKARGPKRAKAKTREISILIVKLNRRH